MTKSFIYCISTLATVSLLAGQVFVDGTDVATTKPIPMSQVTGLTNALSACVTNGQALAMSTVTGLTNALNNCVTNNQPIDITFTNLVKMSDGVLNGTNGVFFTQPNDPTKYWILIPPPPPM